ncbi:damage-inducible protein D [bacterium]|nr:damage-inducible protein D [bacterium]
MDKKNKQEDVQEALDLYAHEFEEAGLENGIKFWYARDLQRFLGYASYDSFYNVVQEAIAICAALKIAIHENFISLDREIAGKPAPDFKLSRFACYLTAMKADSSKYEVALAQAHFAALAASIKEHFQDAERIKRAQVRADLKVGEMEMTSAAKMSGVEDFGSFKDAGYRGMYNKSTNALKKMKGLSSSDNLYDFLGLEELAGNLFRVTQTKARLRNERATGQQQAEEVAFGVGRQVRKLMHDNSGQNPENLPIEGHVNEIQKGVKVTLKEYQRIDKKK